MEDNIAGEWYISETRYGLMVHAKLGIAEENSVAIEKLCKASIITAIGHCHFQIRLLNQ